MTTEIKEAASTAAEKAGEVVETAKARPGEGAGDMVGAARSRARDEVGRRSTQAGERAIGTAGDIRSVGDELRRQGKEAPARIADRAADQTERLGAYLRDADPDTLLGDVEEFGRRRPWAIAAAGMAIGIVAARTLKASSSRRYSRVAGGRGGDEVSRPAGAGVPGAARPSGLGGR
jgi:hypothetical protein